MSEGLAIRARGLTKRYKQVVAVNNLDAVPSGAIYGFLGPNGAGKTTTIRMLDLIRPTSGCADVLGHDIRTARRVIAPNIGAIVEAPAFYSYLRAVQNLEVFWSRLTCPWAAVASTRCLSASDWLSAAMSLWANSWLCFLATYRCTRSNGCWQPANRSIRWSTTIWACVSPDYRTGDSSATRTKGRGHCTLSGYE